MASKGCSLGVGKNIKTPSSVHFYIKEQNRIQLMLLPVRASLCPYSGHVKDTGVGIMRTSVTPWAHQSLCKLDRRLKTVQVGVHSCPRLSHEQ